MTMKTSNVLLQRLAAEEMETLSAHLERIELKRGDVLFESYLPVPYVYFLEAGLSSEIATTSGKRLEVGCVGREGFSGASVALGVDVTPHGAFMQIDGQALRIPSSELQAAMDACFPLRRTLLFYIHVFMLQIAATAIADAKHTVEQRLARWILMAQDRAGDELPLTHEFFSLMLGVRRPSVTDALHVLEGMHCIKAERSLVIVRDRASLRQIAGDAYGVPEAEYRRLILGDGAPSSAD
ncbi:CRP-like cAMP-binding protein [Pseudorhizobium tarimense]|uniref:CRP-like cAMP-binding protein n=1 Tax=Pseudorhizobium tarimense TaxID=1079109 RepID=A0ABV2HB95_9HYPH|nr:Crp/Fnr family transcriptional regulator [Pseudorhizobium tarimense]MCJ8520678.1 Crp/Fnr family transcriptional regulator [Pseudorhizobium tarimense]